MIRRDASIRWVIMLCLGFWSTTSLATVTNVKILIWNVRSYNDPTTAQFAALERVVAAVDPQILLLAEAQNPDGRAKFLADFPQYSYTFLGGPTSDLQRSQIVSVYPLVNTQELYTPDFSRPTIRADVQTDPTTPGMTQLRVYAAHYNASDASVAAAQAAIDQADMQTLLSANPNAPIFYAGDLNSDPGTTPITTIASTPMIQLNPVDPYTGTSWTMCDSNVINDYAFYSTILTDKMTDVAIFNTATFPTPPTPTLAGDVCAASDHLAIVATVGLESNFCQPSTIEDIRINEVFTSEISTDTHEFIELFAACPVSESICFGVLLGDSAGAGVYIPDGTVNIHDLIAVKNHIDQATTANFFLLDVAGSGNDVPDGTINIYDLIAVKNNFDKTIGSSCP